MRRPQRSEAGVGWRRMCGWLAARARILDQSLEPARIAVEIGGEFAAPDAFVLRMTKHTGIFGKARLVVIRAEHQLDHRGHRCERLHGQPRIVEQVRSEEHTSELQSLMRISYAVFCSKKKTNHKANNQQRVHMTRYKQQHTK